MSIKSSDIAVIGMAGKFPGANSVSQFWENTCKGKECITSLSDEELRRAGVPESDINDSTYVKVSAILDDIDKFDPEFFGIPLVEAQLMDPQIRLLLQCAWETLEDSGHAKTNPQDIGVFAGMGGISTNYYSNFVNINRNFEKKTASLTHLVNDKDYLSTYISYRLNLTGPSMTIQTACSTSLVTIHQACLSLRNDECEMALAGGANIRIPHVRGYHYKKGHVFSKSGRIKAFDKNADGVVFGNGLGLVLLKKAEHAIKDGDHIYAVIKSSAVSNDGQGKVSYGATCVKGQLRCIDDALKNAQIDASTIGFVESHGTGTLMGDPIEVSALSKAFFLNTNERDKKYCALGAVKTNVGHLDSASGIVGFIKGVLTLYHGMIPPTLHYEKPNPRIKFHKTPFFVNNTLMEWKGNGKPRRAGVNSLGIGGTNTFVVLEEYCPGKEGVEKVAIRSGDAFIVPLSAQTEESLRLYVEKLADFLGAAAERSELINISDLSYTLQIGRQAMQCRIAFVVSSIDELKNSLTTYLQSQGDESQNTIKRQTPAKDGNTDPANKEDNGEGNIQELINTKKVAQLAEAWVNGQDLDWNKLHCEGKPKRISLPTYAFAKVRCWVDSSDTQQRPSVAASTLHPLLHTNTSNLSQQSYRSTFTGNEFFLVDYHVKGKKALPLVAQLEMAQEAVRQAGGAFHLEEGGVCLKNIVWARPVVVGEEPLEVTIELLPEKDGNITFEIYSDARNPEEERIEYCQGVAQFTSRCEKRFLNLVDLQKKLNASAIDHGTGHQALDQVYVGENQVLVKLASAGETKGNGSLNPSKLHLSTLGPALQASFEMVLMAKTDSMSTHPTTLPYLPFALEGMEIMNDCTDLRWAWIRNVESCADSNEVRKLDVDLCDERGGICARLRSLAFEHRGNDLDYILQETGKEWFALTEEWVCSPLGIETELWSERIGARKDHSILVISEDANHFEAIKGICQEIARVVSKGKAELWRVEYMPVQINSINESDIEPFLTDADSPQTIFLFLPQSRPERGGAAKELELVYSCIQSLMQLAAIKPIQLYCCYQDRQIEHALYREALAGLFKSAMLECINHRYRSISYDGQLTFDGNVALRMIEEWFWDETTSMPSATVPMVRYSNAERFELRADEIAEYRPLHQPGTFREKATYLMVGALGDMGELMCQELGRQYQARLVIFSRRSKRESSQKIARIEKAGASVLYRSVDILDQQALQKEMRLLKKDGVVINGVIHMARRVSDAPIVKKSFREFSEVMSAKVQGTLNIDAATAKEPLDFFLMYSSVAAFGIKGSPDYAYSTAFQNAMARYRNSLVAQGKRAGRSLAICWGQWEVDGGIEPEKMPARLEMMRQMGMDFVDAASAMLIMDVSLRSQSDVLGFVAVNDKQNVVQMMGFGQLTSTRESKIDSTIEAFENGELSKRQFIEFLDTLIDPDLAEHSQTRILQAIRRFERKESVRLGSCPGNRFNVDLKHPLSSTDKSDSPVLGTSKVKNQGQASAQSSTSQSGRTGQLDTKKKGREVTEQMIISNIEKVLGINNDAIDLDKPFQDYGLDSITAIQLTAALEKKFEVSIPPSWLIEYPTINTLTERLNQENKELELAQ